MNDAFRNMTGGPAFPAHAQCGEETGMTLMDHFAAMAMQGLLSAGRDAQYGNGGMADLADSAYMIAAAMIQERKERGL